MIFNVREAIEISGWKVKLKGFLGDAVALSLGCFLYSASIHMFTAPNQIAVGGATGLASILSSFTGLTIGTLSVLLNLPLFLLSYRKLGRRFFWRTAIATGVLSLSLDLVPFLPVFCEDKLLAAIAGGVGSGAGLGMIYVRGMATGGSDLLAKLLLGRMRGLSYGRVILLIDGAVLLLAGVVYSDLWSVLYSAITVWLASVVVDAIQNGTDRAKCVRIITSRKAEVLRGILSELHRGATVWSAEGGFTGASRFVILVVVRKYEVFHLKQTVRRADPDAFVILSDVTEVLGQGFRRDSGG